MTKVKKTVMQFTILHPDDSAIPLDLGDLARECFNGDFIGGNLVEVSSVAIPQDKLEGECGALGSEAGFFDDRI
jgi:hypothetical protein